MKFILIGNGSYVNAEYIESMISIPDEAALRRFIETADKEKLMVLRGDTYPATAIMSCDGWVAVVHEPMDAICDKINQLYV